MALACAVRTVTNKPWGVCRWAHALRCKRTNRICAHGVGLCGGEQERISVRWGVTDELPARADAIRILVDPAWEISFLLRRIDFVLIGIN